MKHQDVIELWQELAEYEIPDYLLEDVRTLLLKVEEQTREEILESLEQAYAEFPDGGVHDHKETFINLIKGDARDYV